MSRMRPRRIAAGLAVAAVSVGMAAALPGSAGAAVPRHTIAARPSWVAKAHRLGATNQKATINFGILLGMRNERGATAALRAVSDPSSSSYGKYLSDAQFRARYAPKASTVKAVEAWLRQQGFSIRSAYRSGMYIQARGTARQVEKTFATPLSQYRFQGHNVRANVRPMSLAASTPSVVVKAISGVVGVDQGTMLKTPADTTPPPATGSRYGVYTQPCSSYYRQKIATDKPAAYGAHQPYVVCGYTPKQIQSAYGLTNLIKHGLDGRGITVAITDAYASPTIYQDTQKYSRFYGLPTLRPGQFRQITPGPDAYQNVTECGGNGWYGEETLDVEAVHTTAPGAKIVYVAGTDCISGLDEAWASSIDNHVADIVTNSWGDGVDTVADLGQSYIDFYMQFSIEAALTGITVNFSTGDDGDQTAGGTTLATKSLSFPSDLPYVSGIGGTSLFINKNGQRVHEYGWQTAYSALSTDKKSWVMPPTYAAGGGGGTSQLFAQPWYQRGAVPASVSHYYGSQAMRATPDISLDADSNSGLIVGQTQVFPNGTYWDRYRIGGTSLASPLMAGVDALAGQAAGRPIGFANPLYYKMLGTNAIHDIVAPRSPFSQVRTDFANFLDASTGYEYRLATVDTQTTTLHDTPGWDDETGVGTPNGIAFVATAAWLSRHHH